MKNSKKMCMLFLIETVAMLAIIAIITISIDPLFHYHKPLSFLQYRIFDQRYQNNGIIKHFNYDSVIIGTSMTENFKTSEFNALFNANAIKVPFSGATFKEIDTNVVSSLKYNKGIKYVVRGIDFANLISDKDLMKYDDYPNYLYDNYFYNDVKYLFNKEILLDYVLPVINYTKNNYKTTTFDEYSNWQNNYLFGLDAIRQIYSSGVKSGENIQLSDYDIELIKENANQNIISTIKNNSNVQFYYFYTPYSIYYFDSLNNQGILRKYIEAERYLTSILVDIPNVHVFSFWDIYDLITDANNYKDTIHYGEKINSAILNWMHSGEHQITKENINTYYDKILNYYLNYDYSLIWK